MKRPRSLVLTALALTVLAAATSHAAQTGVPARKLIAPVRGEAKVEITPPDTKVMGDQVVTIIRVKNTSNAPIAGFKVEENWYKGNDAIGGDSYRHPRPFQVGEVIQITLKTPRARVVGARNQYQFSHANGAVKPTPVKKLDMPKPASNYERRTKNEELKKNEGANAERRTTKMGRD